MVDLTPTQRLIFRYIAKRVSEGKPPSNEDICNKFDYNSHNSAADVKKALAKKGLIEITPKISRGITLTEEGERWMKKKR